MSDSPERQNVNEHEGENEVPADVSLQAAWVGLDEVPVETANQVISQFHQDVFIVSFGMLSPPVLLGSPQQKLKQARDLEIVTIRPVARIGLTRDRLEEFIDVLRQNLDKYDRDRKQKEE